MTKSTQKPKWIWKAAECFADDGYLRARRTFTLNAKPARTRLRITAFTEYALYVNGQYVGSGPAPSGFEEPLLDVYSEADLPLVRGRNVIAVLAHNPHVGTLRRPRATAGLWADLEMTAESGKVQRIVTGRTWRVVPAEDFSRRAPRVYWTAGFIEVRDLRREPKGWTLPRFSDRRWAEADEVKPSGPEGDGAPRPRDRRTPRLAETFVQPREVVLVGKTRWPDGVTAIPFEFTAPNPLHGEFYAATFAYAKARCRARLTFDCDEASAAYVNNRLAVRQGYKEEFLRWLNPEEQNDYAGTGIHRGQGHRAEAAEVELDEGWNSLGVVIYEPGLSWGFAARFDDPKTGEPLDLKFSPDQKAGSLAEWHIVKEQCCPCGDGWIPDTPGPNARTFPDSAYQLAWETRTPNRRAARGAASLVAGATAQGNLELGDGEFAVYDLGREAVGCIEVEVEAAPGTMLDVAWSEILTAAGDVEPVCDGMRQVDRLILAAGRQTVRFFNRRAMRYLELIARTGGDPLTVHRLGVWATSAVAVAPATPQSDERELGGAMAMISRTVEACVQDTLEGAPSREGEQSIPAAFFLSQAERMFMGRTDLGEAALRAFAADQAGDGFFRAIVPAGTMHVVPDWNLLWIIWLADHLAWTGDLALARELQPVAEHVLDWTASFHGAHGLLENKPDRSPWWLFIDLAPMEKQGCVTAWQALYARALLAAADVAELAGDEDSAAHGRAEAQTAVEAARNRLWDPVRGLFADSRLFERMSAGASPQTNYYALYGRLATDEQAERILSNLWEDDRTETASWGPRENPFVKYFALEALLERGHVERALTMIRTYWGAMAKAGLATVPEVFPIAAAPRRRPVVDGFLEGPYGHRPPVAMCHGWGVHPAALVAKWVLGVQPERPGFEPMRFAPMPGDVRQLSGRVWTPKGEVEVSIRRRAGRREITAVLPAGLRYRLDLRHLNAADAVRITGGIPSGK